MHLHPSFSHCNAGICAKGLGDWGQKSSAGHPAAVTRCSAHINRHATIQCNGPGGKDIGFHRHQHAAHISMVKNGASPAGNRRLALAPFGRIVQRVLIGPFSDPNALSPNTKAGIVHHREHRL